MRLSRAYTVTVRTEADIAIYEACQPYASPRSCPCTSGRGRAQSVRVVTAPEKNIEVVGFDNLLIEFAAECGAGVLVRGLRAVSDFEYEFQLASMNRHLDGDIETLFLTPDEKYAFISSTLVKEIARLGGNVSEFVSDKVEQALKQRYGHA